MYRHTNVEVEHVFCSFFSVLLASYAFLWRYFISSYASTTQIPYALRPPHTLYPAREFIDRIDAFFVGTIGRGLVRFRRDVRIRPYTRSYALALTFSANVQVIENPRGPEDWRTSKGETKGYRNESLPLNNWIVAWSCIT
jgi:hypothetical protein